MSCAGVKKPGLIRFSDARLVCLQGSSYIELSKPQPNFPLKSGSVTLNCLYCSKTTSHEHDIIGKVKFDPRAQNFFVSLIPNNKATPTHSSTAVTSSPATTMSKSKEAENKLVIFPVVATEKKVSEESCHVGAVQTYPGSKTVKLFPAMFADEKQSVMYFSSELVNYLDNNTEETENQASFMRAAKENSRNLIHVLKCVRKKSDKKNSDKKNTTSHARSVLKSKQTCKNCVQCRDKTLTSMHDLKRHFETIHGCLITLKSISNDPVDVIPKPAVPSKPPTTIPLCCEDCDLSFDSDELKIAHDNDTHAVKGQVKFQCDKCLQYFKSSQSYKKHKAEHLKQSSKVRKHCCHLCQKRFLKIQHLNDHVNRHFGAKPHQCDLCEKKYTSLFSLKSHKVNSHGIGEKPRCDYCDKTFFNRTLLNRHVLKKHRKDSRLECKHCGHHYLRKDNLEAHIRSVHEVKPGSDVTTHVAKCQLCDKTYGNENNLSDHMRTCHGILPWNVLPKKNGEELDMARLKLELAGSVKCKFCEQTFLPTEMESHLRFSHGVLSVRPGGPTERSITEAAEALLRTLTPQPDYLLRCLTPLPMETLDEIIMESAFNKD